MTVIQRTPNLGLKIRLQPLAGPAAVAMPTVTPAPGGCDVDGVVWLVRPNYRSTAYEGGVEAYWELPNLNSYAAVGMDETGSLIYPDGGAQGPDFVQVRMPVDWGEDTPEPPVTLVGAALGPQVREVVWSVERSGPVTMPCSFDVSGPLAWCVIGPVLVYLAEPLMGYEDITLSARCGGSVVGTLRLQIVLEGW